MARKLATHQTTFEIAVITIDAKGKKVVRSKTFNAFRANMDEWIAYATSIDGFHKTAVFESEDGVAGVNPKILDELDKGAVPPRLYGALADLLQAADMGDYYRGDPFLRPRRYRVQAAIPFLGKILKSISMTSRKNNRIVAKNIRTMPKRRK